MIPKSQDSWVFAKVLILQCASQFRRSPLPYFMFSPPWSSVLRLHPHINCRALPSTWYLGLAAPSRHSPFPFLADPALPWPNSVGTWPYLFACWPGLEVGLGPEMGVCAASKNWDLCIVLSKWKVPALNKEEWPLLLAQDVQGPLEFKTVKCRWHRPTSQSAILPEKNPWLLELWGSFFFSFLMCLLIYLAAEGLSCSMQDLFVVACRISFPNQGSNPGLGHWELRGLAIGPPEKFSQVVLIFVLHLLMFSKCFLIYRVGPQVCSGFSVRCYQNPK